MRVPIFPFVFSFIAHFLATESNGMTSNRTVEMKLNSTTESTMNLTRLHDNHPQTTFFASTNPCAHLNISDCFALITKAMNETEQMLNLANATLRGEETILYDQNISERDHEPVAKAGNGEYQEHLSDRQSPEEDTFEGNNMGSIFPFATNPMDAAKIIESQSVMMVAPPPPPPHSLSQKQPADLLDEGQTQPDSKRDHQAMSEQQQQQRQLLQRLIQQQQLQRAISSPQMGQQNSTRRKRALPQKARSGKREMEHHRWKFPSELFQNQVDFHRVKRNNQEVDQGDKENQIKDTFSLGNSFNLVKILTSNNQEPLSEIDLGLEMIRDPEKLDEYIRQDPKLPKKWMQDLNETKLRNEFVHPVLMNDTLHDINRMHTTLGTLKKLKHDVEETLNSPKRFRRRTSLLDFLSDPKEEDGFQPADSFLAQWASELNDLSKSNPGNGTQAKEGELKNNTTQKNDHPKEISASPLKSVKGLVLKVILAGDSNLTMGQLVDENLVPLRLVPAENEAKEESNTQFVNNETVTETSPSPVTGTPSLHTAPSEHEANLTSSGRKQIELNHSLEAFQTNLIDDNEKNPKKTTPIRDVSNLKHWEDNGLDLKHIPSPILPDFAYHGNQDNQDMSQELYFPKRMMWEEDEVEDETDNDVVGSFNSVTKDLEEKRFERQNNFLQQTQENNHRDPRHMHFHFNRN